MVETAWPSAAEAAPAPPDARQVEMASIACQFAPTAGSHDTAIRGLHLMSASSLHLHFKQVTSMSPLQYQKKLRLHRARQLMLTEGLDAAVAAHRVGYESPSQFSREYRRMFGAPPRTEIQQALGTVAAAR